MTRRILVVVTGGIAAYKAADVVRKLMGHGMEVRVVMTAAAASFVTPLTFQTLSGNQVGTDMFSDPRPLDPLSHLSFARWADLVLVCPATANIIAKIAHGIADDLASSTLLATRAPTVVCPAMNDGMWENPATRENIETLRKRGINLVGPDSGPLACRTAGRGRMSEPITILGEVERLLLPGDRPKVIVTAGGTREPVDRVRVLSNISSGRLGSAIADSCTNKGFDVIMIRSAYSARPVSNCVEVSADSVGEVENALRKHLAEPNVVGLVHCMAVSDFQIGGVLSLSEAFSLFSKAGSVKDVERAVAKLKSGCGKEKKLQSSEALFPILVPGKKLLDSIRKWAQNRKLFLVSFKLTSGASQEEMISIAREQLKRTGSDLVIANDSRELSENGHEAWVVSAGGVEGVFIGKARIAEEIASRIPKP